MTNHYEINVAYNGRHFFATAEHSFTTSEQAKEALRIFTERFPESDGYSITVTYWMASGSDVTAQLQAKIAFENTKQLSNQRNEIHKMARQAREDAEKQDEKARKQLRDKLRPYGIRMSYNKNLDEYWFTDTKHQLRDHICNSLSEAMDIANTMIRARGVR